jgi:hypothetical protein
MIGSGGKTQKSPNQFLRKEASKVAEGERGDGIGLTYCGR